MKTIRSIFANDFKRLTSSIVAILIVIGLCLIPCLYAWFNILSNWAPYEPESTTNIPVAIANEDKGAEMLGLQINVGEKLEEGIKSNDQLGWTFPGSAKKAIEGVRAGDYYAAIVIPDDFSDQVMSFTTNDLHHPKLDYYENEKKNAVAPKITGKAKSALQKEVDEAFIDTLGQYVSEAADVADAMGLEPQQVFGDLGERTGMLGEKLDDCVALVTAATGLSDAANELLVASESLIGSTKESLKTGDELLQNGESSLPETAASQPVSDSIRKETKTISKDLDKIHEDLSKVKGDMKAYNDFVENDLEQRKKLLQDMKKSTDKVADKLSKLGLKGLAERFSKLSDRLSKHIEKLNVLQKADAATWEETQDVINDLLSDLEMSSKESQAIGNDLSNDVDDKVNQAVTKAENAINEIQKSLSGTYDNLDTLSNALNGSEEALKTLDGGLANTVNALVEMQNGFNVLSRLFDTLANNEVLADTNQLLANDTELIAKNLATPIKMKEVVLYETKNNGSAMAPFYTVLAQWVGALFAAVLISAKIKRREMEKTTRLYQRFFGRYRIFLEVGLAQALIVSLGDLFYIGIQCEHPGLFVLAALVNGLVFTLINYALVFALENVGLAIGVIILVLQVAGSGGTFPPEVLPPVFQQLYPFLPFRYALGAMRESAFGLYGNTYIFCLGMLLLFGAVAIVLGMLLQRPARLINRYIDESMRKSDLMKDG